MKFWDMKRDRMIAETGIASFPGFIRPRWSDDGKWIIAGSGDGRTVLFAPCKQEALRPLFARCQDETDDVIRVIGSHEPSWPSTLSRDGSASSDSTRVWRMQAALQPTPLTQSDLALVHSSVRAPDEPLQIYNKVRRENIEFNVPPRSLAAVSADGTHVLVARGNSGPNFGRLMLYNSTNSSEPIAIFQTPITEWKRVGFLTKPDRIVAVAASGVATSWLYFRDLDLLTKFALERLPLQDGQTVELSGDEQCRFGIGPCQELFASQGANRPEVF